MFRGCWGESHTPVLLEVFSMLDRKRIGLYCKHFRTDVLHYVCLADFCRDYGLNYKTIWAFENGKCQNIKYPVYYYNACFTEYDKNKFVRGFFECL
jgi:hypothetical protein